jgi:hypothetical protein
MQGIDWPNPLSAVFHATSSSESETGRFDSIVWLDPSGPPQRGQFTSARAEPASETASIANANPTTRRQILKFMAASLGNGTFGNTMRL